MEFIAKLAKSSFVHVLFAFLIMGTWAYYANSNHPWPKPLIAGVVQGLISASITFVVKRTVEIVSAALNGFAALVLPAMAASMVSFICLVGIHTLVGTPEVWLTIALPFAAALLYVSSYSFALWKSARAKV